MSLRARLLLAFAYVLLLAVVALGVPLAVSLSDRVNAEVRSQAEGQADTVAATAADLLQLPQRHDLRTTVASAASAVRGRVVVIDTHGAAIADSASPGAIGASYTSRPEVAAALHGRRVQFERTSHTLGQAILATAVPIIHEGAVVGVVRITQGVNAVHSAIARVLLGLALLAGVVLILGLVAGSVIAGQIARPLRRLETVARRIAGGALDARAPVEGSREQRSLGRSFNEMADRVSRILTAQRTFIADASHQLRTPLTGLRLRLEEAEAVGVSDAAAAELRAGIAEIDRLAHTVDELLVLSRADEHDSPEHDVELREVIEAALARWRPFAQRSLIDLEAHCEAPALVRCNRADLERALDVLVENALLYSLPGTRVTILLADSAIQVLDEGPGIDEHERDRIFERFARGRAASGRAGTGLGLPIARALMRPWGAEVTLANRPGGGAVARIDFVHVREASFAGA